MSSLDNDNSSSDALDSALILVVDDDHTQAMTLKAVLNKKGYRVVEANSGKDAISIFEQQHPTMILLDAVMPDIDGFETCRRIKSLEEGKDTLILMLTGLNDDESVEQAFKAGAIDYITKPISWSVLFGRVSYLLQSKINEQNIHRIEKQLRHAQKMESIGNLTSGIAHNFNNILTSILGYSELLIDTYATDDNSKPAQYSQQIYKSATRARDFISQMQSFASKGSSNPEVLIPSTLLNETIRMLRPTLPTSIELHLQIPDELPAIKIDPVQFQQMIMNILINAREAMNNKGSIDITLQKVETNRLHCASCHHEINGEFIELSIKDTGTGIENEVLKKMFDPYYSHKPFFQANGMGLSVVHGIVHECAGHILVETTLGQGTIFKIFFPVTDIKLAITEKAHETEEEVILEPGSSKHILIVDDEEVVGNYEAELLQNHGYKATFMNDPVKAIKVITDKPDEFDLVLSDKTMPKLDGLELAGAIMAVRKDLPVILCTGYSGSLPDIDLGCIGIRAKLNKPVEGKKLLQTIKTVLEKK